MKHLKTYENVAIMETLKVGYYVLVKFIPDIGINEKLYDYYNNHIGKIEKIKWKNNDTLQLKYEIDQEDVHYFDIITDEIKIDKNDQKYVIVEAEYDEIMYYAKTKDELILKIEADKYNL